MKKMNQFLIAIIMVLGVFMPKQILADVPNFDVIEYSNGKESLYIRIWSSGVLKDNDLCYYNWSGEYLNEVENVVEGLLRNDSAEVYSELVKIDVRNVYENYVGGRDSILYILKGFHKVPVSMFKDEYELVGAENANTAGYTYTEELTNSDNIWLKDYDIEVLFNLTDYELCNMTIYSIKNNVPKERIWRLKEELDDYLKAHDRESFYKRLSELHQENIIMIGFCSC